MSVYNTLGAVHQVHRRYNNNCNTYIYIIYIIVCLCSQRWVVNGKHTHQSHTHTGARKRYMAGGQRTLYLTLQRIAGRPVYIYAAIWYSTKGPVAIDGQGNNYKEGGVASESYTRNHCNDLQWLPTRRWAELSLLTVYRVEIPWCVGE